MKRKYTDEERKERDKETNKRWKARNAEKLRQYQRERQARLKREDREAWRKMKREDARKYRNNDKLREVYLKRLEIMLAGSVTRQQLIKLFELSNERCHYCGIKIKRPRFTPHQLRGFDHIIPLCKGGKHQISNLVVCCKACNDKKGQKILAYDLHRRLPGQPYLFPQESS